MPDEIDAYGFSWGPMTTTRLTAIPGSGRVMEVETDHARIQIYVTEAGRKITVTQKPPKPGGRRKVGEEA